MAKKEVSNLPAKMYQAGNRTIKRLRFIINHDPLQPLEAQEQYIDLAQCLSLVNRRLYRQGLMYYVNGVQVISDNGTDVQIQTIPDTWVAMAAWRRAFKRWKQMLARGAKGLPTSKYQDFKVFMNQYHEGTSKLLPYAGGFLKGQDEVIGITAGEDGEWQYAEYHSGDPSGDTHTTDSFSLHMCGDHTGSDPDWTSIGAIRSFMDTRFLPAPEGSGVDNNLNEAETDPLDALWDYSDNENDIREDKLEDWDEPPYDRRYAFGGRQFTGQSVACEVRTGGTGAQESNFGPGFVAPLGLLRVTTSNGLQDADLEIIIDVVEGPYQGVYAERII